MKILDPNGLVDNLCKYVQINIEIAKVEVQEKIEDMIKKVVLIAILAITGMIFLMFLLITLALFMNKILENQYLGFLVITVILGVVGGLVYVKINHLLEQPRIIEKLDEL